ncbi:MAG: polyprenyl synthetase family protein [Peptococcaceae bacterium]|nr:polyprenyl synthetase family protein [Peptococcaceae bacterium]
MSHGLGGEGLGFAQVYSQYAAKVDVVLNDLIPQRPAGDPREDILEQSMRYGVMGGGKRVRPVLALASCDLVGGDVEKAVVPAAAIELIHTYSLIHDDLPCMDDDDMRRDQPTAHKAFGEAVALLAGDALVTYAFEVLSRPSALLPEIQLRLVHEVAEAAGCRGMVLGQVLDTITTLECQDNNESQDNNGSQDNNESQGTMETRKRAQGLAHLERIHILKTGRLLRVSARLGALCGGCSPEQLALLTCYAENVGLVFQIQDDILDEIGQSENLGKNVGSDARLGKMTYVSLLGLEEAVRQRDLALAEAERALEFFGEKADFLWELAEFMASRER